MTAGIDLASQIEELRRTVATLEAAMNAQPRLSLTAAGPGAYLGQAVSLAATVAARADSAPVPGVPVTLVTSWGVLRGDDDLIEGTSIAAVTGTDGTVRVTLRPRTSLDENEDHDALEAMATLLDPAAASPADAAPALETLAQQYRWEANHGFRNAVDAYFRDFGQSLVHGTLLRDYMTAWTLIPATVIAYIGETEKNSAAAATLTIKIRNWLGPWFQVYQQHANSQIQLAPDFQFVKQQAGSAAGLIAGVFDRAGILVDAEYGEIGKTVAQRVAQNAIGTFLDTGISDLPTDTRVAVGPALDTGSRALATAGAGVVATLGQTHAEAVTATGALVNKVDKADLDTKLAVKANASDLAAVQTAVGAKADQTAFQTFQTQINSAVAAKANAADLQAIQTTVGAKADKTALDALQAKTTSALASKADQAAFQTFQTQINSAVAVKANASDLQAIQATIGTKADKTALDTLQAQTNSALARKVDTDAFDSFRKQVNDKLPLLVTRADLAGLQAAIDTKADKSALTVFQSQTNAALAAKADLTQVTSIQGRIGSLEGRIR